MLRILGTVFAALLGLAFGSFLNVCLSRWPEGESVVHPRSHCRTCHRTLTWWENIPVLSWLFLRARCRTCCARIGIRYVLVEVAIAALWGIEAAKMIPADTGDNLSFSLGFLLSGTANLALCWILVALAILDAENLWLPDFLTLPGVGLGLLFTAAINLSPPIPAGLSRTGHAFLGSCLAALAGAGLILLIRGVYWLLRRQEGIGLGDAKLMALLGAWLGFPGALLAFALGVILGAFAAVIVLIAPKLRRQPRSDELSSSQLIPDEDLQIPTWSAARLPLGTFLCIGGIVSALWGPSIIQAYLTWSGF